MKSSALQRAENSSIDAGIWQRAARWGFSALQRAENSSISAAAEHLRNQRARVSVLFSEPKIPQWCRDGGCCPFGPRFSALQRAENSSITDGADVWHRAARCFSALQRAENSSIWDLLPETLQQSVMFQCSSASRKFLNERVPSVTTTADEFQCSSASRKFLN